MKPGVVIRCASVLALLCAVVEPTAAQTWPARSIRIIVPFTPSGGVDAVARMLAQKLTEQMHGPFVVDNRPGAGGAVGAELVARAAPDGYTLLVAAAEFSINPGLRPKLPYDPFKNFAHISQLVSVQYILASHPSVPVNTAKELIALAKARPAQLTYGSSGTGSGIHLAGELFQLMSGIKWVHVPFKGAGPASIAAMSGDIDFVIAATIGLLGPVRSGRLHAVGVTGLKRFAELPHVPTIAESGVPGYNATGWYGFYAPGGTSPELVRRLYAEAKRALSNPEVREKLAQAGSEYVMSPPEEFVEFIHAEIAKWTRVAEQAGTRID
jgi:tripartite-type tricarboxylate transporter receptor subunit TctC